jgi:SAM-dependent methyltransferase
MNDLDDIADYYKIEDDFDMIFMKYNFEVAEKYFFGKTFLELGCATGESTIKMLDYADTIDVVEGSIKNIETSQKKINRLQSSVSSRVKFHHSDWFAFDYALSHYSDIVFFRGLEHLSEPDRLLKQIKGSLTEDGRIHIVIPNALSLHRKIGVSMGLLKSTYELNERDKKVGHFKVYDRHQVEELLRKAGYEIITWKGIFLKMLPNDEMLRLYKNNPEFIKALFSIGNEFPEQCAEIYICAKPKKI